MGDEQERAGPAHPDVSRETPSGPPAPPAVARRVFSSVALPRMERYAAALADAGVVRGLIGPREVPRLWERHLLNCAVVAEVVPDESTVCDIGSGAGLPGLVLAIHRPDLHVTLVEPLLRRTVFLEETVDELGLDNVRVIRGRAEDLHGTETFDVVTSRAVAPLDRLLRWSWPLVAPGGAVIALKGSSAPDEIAAARKVLRRFGCGEPSVHQVGVGVLARPTTVVRVAAPEPPQVGWPDVAAPRSTGDAGHQEQGGGPGA